MYDKDYYLEVANRLRVEMDGRSPRLRLSLIAALTDAGYLPTTDDAWLDNMKTMLEWVSEEADGFMTMIEELKVIEPKENEKDQNAYSILKDDNGLDGPYL